MQDKIMIVTRYFCCQIMYESQKGNKYIKWAELDYVRKPKKKQIHKLG